MSFTKALGNDLTVSLLSEDPFLYAHLVKFEKVSKSADGQISEKASDYSYITDASFDIEFDDGSNNLAGASNGTQTYIANRLTKVSTVSETTEAKVSNVNLTVSSIGLDSKFTGSSTSTVDITNSSSSGCSIGINVDTPIGSELKGTISTWPVNDSASHTLTNPSTIAVNNTSGGADFTGNNIYTQGKKYLVTYTVSNYTSGQVGLSFSTGTLNIGRAANGTYTEIGTCTGNNLIYIRSGNSTVCTVVVDSIKEAGNTASWTDLGFSEGDKIVITSLDSNNGKSLTIAGFTSNNYTATCVLPSVATSNVTSGANYNITLETDEVAAILNDPSSASYNGYINREVTINKAHIDPSTGAIIGVPYTLFKGIISKAKLTDDPTKSSNVNWTLTSHWGDFIRVNGRITSDAEHRAFGADAQPDFGALYRADYAMDLGFMHGDQAINMMSIYQVKETRYKLKKSGWIFKKYKMKEYEVEVDREVDLRINLEAKRLPVIYGVQRTDSIPIFADSLYSDPAKIYVAYAICEGEIGGLYDIYVDDQSRICIDKNDSDTRSTQTDENTIDVVCEGRMDRGDTLSSAPSVRAGSQRGFARGAGSFNIYEGGIYSGIGNWQDNLYYEDNLIANSSTVNGSTGITHEKQTTLTYPINSRLVFHSGKSHQRADDTLTRIAQAGRTVALKANGFKLQADTEFPEEYWTSNHRLLDTAYVVAEYEIAEGDVTIPSLDFVVRGREIEQYNYDYSYDVHPNPTLVSGTITDKRALFKAGDIVDFYTLAAGNAALATDVQIMDSTIYYDAEGTAQYKFRFSESPLGTSTSTTEFYMVQANVANTSDARYPMITWDYKSNSGTVATRLTQEVTVTSGDGKATSSNTDVSAGVGVDISELTSLIQGILAASGSSISVGFVANGQSLSDDIAKFMVRQANPVTSGGTTTDKNAGPTQVSKSSVEHYALLNAIKLADTASSIDNYYKGQIITVVSTDSAGLQKRQSRKIVKYTGSSKVAVVGALFNVAADATPVSGTFTTTAPSWQTNTITLNSVSGLSVNQFLIASTDSLAYIEAGTQITAINGLTITVNKEVRLKETAVISALASGGAEQTKEHPTNFDFVPSVGDTYEIASEGDKKVSINPAVQLLDYLTNGRYGRGLDLDKDINLDTFKQSARLCDTRSNVNLILPTSGTYTVGAKWKYSNTVSSVSYLQWQGTIESVVDAGTGYKQVTFTDCIGKIAHKWFDWKSYEIGNAVYHKVGGVNKVYLVSVAGTIAEPTTSSTNFTALAITNVSTSATVNVHGVSSGGATESNSGERDNPIVKSWNGGNYEKSGYNLYDSDDVKYWRYTGWQEHNQREVTRHQTNALIRTDNPLFDNINSMLKHFNGILRHSNGKYELDVESTTPTIAATSQIPTSSAYTGSAGASNTSDTYRDPRIINEGDIIGAITVDDSGLKGIANTVSVSIADPNIRYDTRSVNFFKSEYLKEDRNIPKKKDIKTPLITNYFNARINAEQYLDQSRFSRKINFVIGPKGILLLAGNIIKMNYERFGWVNKDFRVSNLSYRPDCSVQVTAEEHNDDTYIISAKEKTYQSAGPISAPGDEIPAPAPPSSFTATGGNNIVSLSWVNTLNFGNPTATGGASAGWATEIYYNNNASFTNQTADTVFSNGATRLHTTQGQETWEHAFPDILVDTTRYYWIRHVKTITKPNGARIQKLSSFTPVNTGDGTSATAVAASGGSGIVYLYKSSVSAPTDDPSDDTLFPTVVLALSGTNAGKITGVAADQGSAALTANQIIDTAGAGTGWYIVPQSPTDGTHLVWVIAATGNSTGANDEILRAEWTEPVQFSGTSGLSKAVVDLYQLTNSSTAPTDPNGTLVYTFATGVLATNNLNGWSQTPASPTSTNNYLWKITAAAISYEDTHTIPVADWSTAIRAAQYVAGADGAAGDSGPRASNFIIYHSAGAATSPGNPTASLYTFANNTFTSLSSGWSTTAPTATGGTTTSNYWYATVNVQEGLDGNGDGTGNTSGTGGVLTISNAYIGIGFTGLVTFTALSTSGSTTIHGGSISTGTITANKIVLSGINTGDLTHNAGWTDDTAADTAQDRADSAYNLAGGKNKTFYQTTAPTSGMIEGDLWVDSDATDLSAKYHRRSSSAWVAINPSTVGGWTLTTGSLYSGTQVTGINDTFTSGAGHISLNSGGSIHTPQFYVNQAGNAGFKGTVTIGSTNLTTTNTLNANTTKADVGLGSVDNNSTAVIRAGTTKADVGLGSVDNNSTAVIQAGTTKANVGLPNVLDGAPGSQVQQAFTGNTNIASGKIRLQSSSQSSNANNCIELDATTNTIVVKDAGVSRVIIGKLS